MEVVVCEPANKAKFNFMLDLGCPGTEEGSTTDGLPLSQHFLRSPVSLFPCRRWAWTRSWSVLTDKRRVWPSGFWIFLMRPSRPFCRWKHFILATGASSQTTPCDACCAALRRARATNACQRRVCKCVMFTANPRTVNPVRMASMCTGTPPVFETVVWKGGKKCQESVWCCSDMMMHCEVSANCLFKVDGWPERERARGDRYPAR